ncbi:MAG: hypothetical protein JWR18_2604 [Segetibacter sp.]|jgi:hypothetical protein|nr:hypothetical protein [Segetibacter sp.]
MKSLISVIYLQTNSVSGEKIAVGLLGISEKEIFFQSSEHKLKLAAKLSLPDVSKHAEYSFELISNKVNDANKEFKSNSLFHSPSKFNKEYIEYLNKYSQGLLQFDMPKAFAANLDKKTFRQLYQQFVGTWEENEATANKKEKFYSTVKKQLKKKIFAERADVEYVLQPDKVHGILLPQDIAVISKNGNLLAAQPIDFTASIDVIGKHAYELEVIFNSLEKFGKDHIKANHKGSYYLLFNKPEKNSEQEKLLNEIIKTKSGIMNIEEASYLGELEHTLEENNYSKFSAFAETL